MTKLQYPLCGPQVCLQRAACLTCLMQNVVHSFSRQWEKEVGLIVTKMVASVRNEGKLLTLEEKLSVIHFTRFRVTR
jgi:hypothetical protein